MSVFLTVRGTGSFSLAGAPIWRGPACYEVAPRFVDELLDYLASTPGASDWLTVTDYDPNYVPPDPPTGTLQPADLAWNRSDAASAPAAPAPTIDPQGLPLDFACEHCERAFPSEGSRERHTEFEHANVYNEHLDSLRAAHEQARAEQAEQDRLQAHEESPKALGEDSQPTLPVWEKEAAGAD